jgi:rhodanese-related sulfurtransferase
LARPRSQATKLTIVDVPTVSAADLPDDAFLLDVREPDEWAAGHPPTARHLPMMQIPARASEIPDDRDVVVVCRVGQRSAQVVAYLMHHGWTNLRNLDGGLVAWAAAGRPLVDADGGVGYVA